MKKQERERESAKDEERDGGKEEGKKEREKIKILDINEFNKTINNVIIKEEITENKNITLSKLINDLNNSTWIKEGLKYDAIRNNSRHRGARLNYCGIGTSCGEAAGQKGAL